MENTILVSLATSDGQGKIDMLKHAAEKLGLHVTDTEICAFGQSRLLRQLAPGDYVLVDNTGVAGNKTDLYHVVSKCFWGAMEFIVVKSEAEMYRLIPSLTPEDFSCEIVDISF